MSIIQQPGSPGVPGGPFGTLTVEEPPVESASGGSSFKARLAKRRDELAQGSVFEVPVKGYEGLWARYRVLGYEELRSVGVRVESETDDPITGERLTAADTLSEAIVDLLEFKGVDAEGRPVFEALNYRWTPAAARDLFDASLPQGVTDRDAILAIFPYPRDTLMMKHFEDFLEAGMGYLSELETVMAGESTAPSGPTSSVS